MLCLAKNNQDKKNQAFQRTGTRQELVSDGY